MALNAGTYAFTGLDTSVFNSKYLAGYVAGGGGGGGGDPPPAPSGLEYTLSDVHATKFWVDPAAGNNANPGTEALPFATMKKAFQSITGPAEIIVKNGTYDITTANKFDMEISDDISRNYSPIPSGTGWADNHVSCADMVLIRAETPFGVRFRMNTAGTYYDSMVRLTNAQYVRIDGFIFDDGVLGTSNHQYMVSLGSNNYLSRCIIRDGFNYGDRSWVDWVSGCLIEQCAGVGAQRYGFGSGNQSGTFQNNVIRLCVGRCDMGKANVPAATFNCYGNTGGAYGVKNYAFFNCIDVDSLYFGGSQGRYSSYYNAHSPDTTEIRGMVCLHNEVRYSGLHIAEEQGKNSTCHHSVVWDQLEAPAETGGTPNVTANNVGLRYAGGGSNNTFSNMTVGKIPGNFLYSAVVANDSQLSDSLDGVNKSIVYQAAGADARYLIGPLGTRYGDANYNVEQTDEPVFPWPYENEIRSVFREQMTPAASHKPTSYDAKRGFCADDQTLTNYIIKYENADTILGDIYP